MQIGLVDVDGHAKKKKWGATIYPNLALCKISRYHKQQGDEVEWAFAPKHYDRISHWWHRLQKARCNHTGNWIYAYAQPYRDPDNPHRPIPQWQKDMAQWVNKKAHFVAHSFEEFTPRKGFSCKEYFQSPPQ